MQVLQSTQSAPIQDSLSAKRAMLAPIVQGTLNSLARDRMDRLGGRAAITLHDLARESLAGSGDAGICFEYAVHEAIDRRDPMIEPLVSEALENFCGIRHGAESLLFGPEKDGVIPILQTVTEGLTPESTVHVGTPGRPPKLLAHLPRIFEAFRNNAARRKLPVSIRGIWKADLFVGNPGPDCWVGTSVKIDGNSLEAAPGLRIAVYPKRNLQDIPRLDDQLNLVRLPLPYDNAFMELFYQAFRLFREFIAADARLPSEILLPHAEDRYIASELVARRGTRVIEVMAWLSTEGQTGIVAEAQLTERSADLVLSEQDGLRLETAPDRSAGLITIVPGPTANDE